MALRIGMCGLGKTGSIIASKIIKDKTTSLVLASTGAGNRFIGWDIGKYLGRRRYGVKISGSDTLEHDIGKSSPRVMIDFTSPEASLRNLEIFAKAGVNAVIGTTGFSTRQLKLIDRFAKRIAIVLAPNITEGVNILMALSRITAKLWPGADIDIIETHHRGKKDAPSGTAKLIARKIHEDDSKRVWKSGMHRGERGHEIRVHSVRSGGVISRHEVHFATQTQTLAISHSTIFRDAFGSGAIKAARWLATKSKGLYYMEDVLGLKTISVGT